MGERLKELRKSLGLTQQEFADRLGIKRNAITNYEVGRNAPADMVVSLICREFNVSENWLRTGEGSMFQKQESFSLDEFAKARGASEIELEILKVYFEIDPKIRHVLIDHLQSHFTKAPGAPDTPGELEKQCPSVEDETQAG